MPIRKKSSSPPIKEDFDRGSEVTNKNEFVYVEKSVTQNMGDYNSAKVTIGVQIPLNPSYDKLRDVVKTITVATDIVDARLEEELNILLEGEKD